MIRVTGADVPSEIMTENAKLTEAGFYSTDAGRGRQVAGASNVEDLIKSKLVFLLA